MRNLWVRIGLGAGFVFVAGMFFLALGRQVKNSLTSTVENGGRFQVPLAILPFNIDHSRIGSIQTVDVRHGPDARQVKLTVRLKRGFEAADYAECAFLVDGPRHDGLFSCVDAAEAEAHGYRTIGEVTLMPGEMVRPLMVAQAHAEEWFDTSDAEQVNIQAGQGGASIKVTGPDGTRIVDITTGADGAALQVKSQDGKEVVNLSAGSAGVKVDVKKP